MPEPLLTHDRPLLAGEIVDRPNRFVVRVRFDSEPERAFLGDPGALEGIVEPGNEVLCSAVDDPDRATDYDAIAVRVGDGYVSVRAALANDLFARALDRGLLDEFREYDTVRREPPLPDGGRADFLLEHGNDDARAYVEVKSATFARAGVAMFPDRQTQRGRRHLRNLAGLLDEETKCHVVFVVQRPDVEALRPYRAVDPAFADLLAAVRTAGVSVRAIATAFDPPEYGLVETDLPVRLG